MGITKFYVDISGNYIGGFAGEHGIDLSAYIEVSNPPQHAAQKYDFVNQAWLPLQIQGE